MTSRNYRTKVNSPSGTIADSDSFTFDRAGHMVTAVSGRYSNTVTYTHDLVGRKATEALTTNGQSYTIGTEYNTRGELVKYTYPDSSIQERTYHATGALNLLKLDGNTVSTRTYDDGTRLTGETLGNGVAETRAYSNDNLLTSITYGGTGTAIGNLSYTWDTNKNKTSETIGGVMANWGFTSGGTTYDHEDRLTGYARTGSSAPSQLSQSWSLTSVGDWNSTTINGTAHTRTHGPTHELLTNKVGTAAAQSVTTDVKGNMTSIPANLRETGATTALNLTWDFDNRMKSADIDANGTADVTFTYDALGRRVTRSHGSGSWVFVQSAQQTLCDYVIGRTPGNALYRYVYGSYIDEPVVRKQTGTGGTLLYYHRNQQYSIYAITNSSGGVVERYAYTAYSQPTFLNSSGSVISNSQFLIRNSFTAREWDHTVGLHYFRARWMSGNSGRFTGRDPIGLRAGVNLYNFVMSRTLSATDPAGLETAYVTPKPTPENTWGLPSYNPWAGPLKFEHNEPNKRCIFYFPPFHQNGYHSMGTNSIPLNGGFSGVISDPKTIPGIISSKGCCEIMFVGHQGANFGYFGGVTSEPPGQAVVPVLPDEGLENEIRTALTGKCSGCSIFFYACGGGNAQQQRTARSGMATRTGCDIYGQEGRPNASPISPYDSDALKPGGEGAYCTADKSQWGKKPYGGCYGTNFPFHKYPTANPLSL